MIQKALQYYSQRGFLNTVGRGVTLASEGIRHRCRNLEKIKDQRGEYSASTYDLICAWKAGVDLKSYYWLGLSKHDPAVYYTDQRVMKDKNRYYSDIIDNKFGFYLSTSPYIDCIPEVFGRIYNGQFYPLKSIDDMFDIIRDEQTIVVKPTLGSGGSGFLKISSHPEGVEINNGVVSYPEFRERTQDLNNQIVMEYVDQHDYSKKIYPDATNTIRILTAIDPKVNEAKVIRAVHRFGSSDSGNTDNWSRGGYCAPINVAEGKIKQVILLNDDYGRERVAVHPETGVRVADVSIPYWKEAIHSIKNTAELHRLAPIVGWDVLISPDGPKIIEGNSSVGRNIIQLESGLYENEVIRRILGII